MEGYSENVAGILHNVVDDSDLSWFLLLVFHREH